jgi:hypothetical protein
MRQCKLQNNRVVTVAWIPEKFAKKGNTIKLKIKDKWYDGWEVLNVYNRMSSKVINENSQNYKKHRKATDI